MHATREFIEYKKSAKACFARHIINDFLESRSFWYYLVFRRLSFSLFSIKRKANITNYENVFFRAGRLQPLHLPPTPGVHGHGPGIYVPAIRASYISQGVHRQTDQLVEMFRVRIVRQCQFGSTGDRSHERIPNRYQAAQSPTQTGQRGRQAVLTKDSVGVLIDRDRQTGSGLMIGNPRRGYLHQNWLLYLTNLNIVLDNRTSQPQLFSVGNPNLSVTSKKT